MGAISPLSNNKRSLTMKKIIALTIIAAMMTGCGKMADLMQPKVIEKRVEVPAKFSWKDEFKGKRCAVKILELAAAGVFAFITYEYGRNKGLYFFESMTKTKTLENLVLQQQLAGARSELVNLHTVVDTIKHNNELLEERYKAALNQIEALGHNA
jgi:uncharacterized protein YceK